MRRLLLAAIATAATTLLVPATAGAATIVNHRAPASTAGARVHAATQARLERLPAAAEAQQGGGVVSPWRTPNPAAPVTPATDACGTVLEQADGTPWTCSFVDDFSGPVLDPAKWSVMTTAATGFSDGSSCYVDSPDNVAVGDGTLKLTTRRLAAPADCPGTGETAYTSGFVTTAGKFAQAYGRFEFRAKFPATRAADGSALPGVQSSLWMWPQDQARYGTWPGSGEIDVAEFFSAHPDRAIPYLHYTPDATPDQAATNTGCTLAGADTAFHTYLLEWTPTLITISFDGRTCLRTHWSSTLGGSAPFDQPFFLSLTQGLGVFGNAPTEATRAPATMTVDWVKVWK